MSLSLRKWHEFVFRQEESFLFVTVSGAHLYGFESPDSDVDLRGVHKLPLENVLGLYVQGETREFHGYVDGIEVDLVTHDVGKYFNLLVKNNGYVLEQIFSPLVVVGGEFLLELREIARRCITKFHYYHYRGFYGTQRKLLEKSEEKTAKQLLYAYRVLLTGINLLRTGEVIAHLPTLALEYSIEGIEELIASKTQENIVPVGLDWNHHFARLDRLEKMMEQEFEVSTLPENRDTEAVNEFLVRTRLRGRG